MKRAPRDGSKKAAIIACLLEGCSVSETAKRLRCNPGYVCTIKQLLKESVA